MYNGKEFNNLEGERETKEKDKTCLQAANISVFRKQFFFHHLILEINIRLVKIVLAAVFVFNS